MKGETATAALAAALPARRLVAARAGILAVLLMATAVSLTPAGPAAAQGGAEPGASTQPSVRELQERRANGGGGTAAEPIDSVEYEVVFEGIEDSDLLGLLSQVSQLAALQNRPPPSLPSLRRRAEEDIERLRQALRSEGYYAATLDYSLEQAEGRPVQVKLAIEPGTLYLLEDYRIEYVGSPPPAPTATGPATADEEEDDDEDEGPSGIPQGPEDLDLTLGGAARAPDIVAAQDVLARALKENGYPLVAVIDRKAVVDHELGSMSVTVTVDAGPPAGFGPATFVGLEKVEEDTLQDVLPWTPGEAWDQGKIDEARILLARTELFDSVVFEPADSLDAEGNLPMTIQVVEGDHRSIGGGLNFSTDIGPGVELFWEHRNLFARNERLRLSLGASTVERSAEADFRKPRFLLPEQALLANLTAVDSTTNAYDERSIKAYTGLERSVATIWSLSGGLEAEYSQLEDEDGQRTFAIYGTPLGVARDSSDDLLNPTEGTRIALTVTPSVGTIDESIYFLTSDLSASGYLSVTEDDSIVLAARGRVASIVGTQTDILPANRRLYAGGGGSVRGYEFQSVGPEDEGGDPSGGRSAVEVGLEARFRIYDDFGIVPFIDGGIVEDSAIPNFETDFLWAAGLGLRYFTPIGPLRLDVAVPINPRDSDDFFQFYISLGQAF